MRHPVDGVKPAPDATHHLVAETALHSFARDFLQKKLGFTQTLALSGRFGVIGSEEDRPMAWESAKLAKWVVSCGIQKARKAKSSQVKPAFVKSRARVVKDFCSMSTSSA